MKEVNEHLYDLVKEKIENILQKNKEIHKTYLPSEIALQPYFPTKEEVEENRREYEEYIGENIATVVLILPESLDHLLETGWWDKQLIATGDKIERWNKDLKEGYVSRLATFDMNIECDGHSLLLHMYHSDGHGVKLISALHEPIKVYRAINEYDNEGSVAAKISHQSMRMDFLDFGKYDVVFDPVLYNPIEGSVQIGNKPLDEFVEGWIQGRMDEINPPKQREMNNGNPFAWNPERFGKLKYEPDPLWQSMTI